MEEHEYYSSVSPKGQITLPAKIRKELGIKPKNQVAIYINTGEVRVRPIRSKLLAHYGKAGSLRRPLDWDSVTRIAADEHAEHAAREGLEE